jgi:hypothetical protein
MARNNKQIKNMTVKQLIRKRNKLVVLAIRLQGEEEKAVRIAIQIIDTILDNK